MAGEDAPRIEPGAEPPPFSRAADFPAWNRYAAVNEEFVPIHMDDAAGREAGYPAAIGMGNLQWAYLHAMLSAWVGERGRIVRVACQFRGASVRGGTVHARGRVTRVEARDGETHAELDVWTEDDEGAPLAKGTAAVAFPNDDGMKR